MVGPFRLAHTTSVRQPFSRPRRCTNGHTLLAGPNRVCLQTAVLPVTRYGRLYIDQQHRTAFRALKHARSSYKPAIYFLYTRYSFRPGRANLRAPLIALKGMGLAYGLRLPPLVRETIEPSEPLCVYVWRQPLCASWTAEQTEFQAANRMSGVVCLSKAELQS